MVTAELLIVPFIVFYIIYFVLLISFMVYSVIYYISFFKLFESIVPHKALKYMILSVLVPLAHGICLYRARNEGYSVEAESTDTPVTAIPNQEAEQSVDSDGE